jgi:hypothetical protein
MVTVDELLVWLQLAMRTAHAQLDQAAVLAECAALTDTARQLAELGQQVGAIADTTPLGS